MAKEIVQSVCDGITGCNLDVPSMLEYFADDCEIMAPGFPIIVGKEALKAHMESQVTKWHGSKMKYTCEHAHAVSDELYAGRFSGCITRDGNPVGNSKGIMMVKMVDGKPKVRVECFNFDQKMPEK